MDAFFDLSFWQGLVLLVVGIPAGFGVRYGATWLWDYCVTQPRERAKTCTHKQQMVNALLHSIGQNLGLLVQLRGQLQSNEMPTYNLDMTLLDATASAKYELVAIDVCEQVDTARFELHHFARKVDWLGSITMDGTVRAMQVPVAGRDEPMSLYTVLATTLKESMDQQMQTVEQECNRAKDRLQELL